MVSQASALNAHVLVLNRHWVAVHVTNARRAFSLVSRNLAEIIHVADGSYTGHDFESWVDLSVARRRYMERDHDWVRTIRVQLAVPKVIRLLDFSQLPRHQVKLNRRNIFARDRSICQYCGDRFPTSELSLDHVVPRTQNGGSTWENLVCCCVRCNARKGGRTPVQAGMKLIRKPIKPKRNPVISLRLGTDKYACWQAVLDEAYWGGELQ